MKPTYIIIAAIIAIILPSCVQVSRTDPRTGITTKATVTMSKGAYVTVDGPVPSVSGYLPVTKKNGAVTGYKPIFSPVTANTPTALFAAYDLDQTDVPKQALKAARDWGISLVAGEVTKYIDDNKTKVDTDKINADARAASEANNLKITQENNRHTEALTEMEVPAAPTP